MSNKKFYLTKRSNGIYYIGWKEGEKIRWKSTKCDKKSDAIHYLQSFKVDEIDIEETPFLTELWKKYNQTQVQHIRRTTIQSYELALKSFVTVCGDKQIDKYTLQDVERYKQYHLSRNLSASSVNIYYRSIKVIFNFGVRNEFISKTPFSKSSQIKVPQRMPLYLTAEDLQQLLSVVQEQVLKDIFRFAVFTGMRLNEITNMKWTQVDFIKKQISVENTDTFLTKSGRVRTVPMHDEVIKMLERIQSQCSGVGYVFVKKSGFKFAGTFVSHTFKKYVRLAKLNDGLKFHSCRHSAASAMSSQNVSLFIIQKILGHANISTTSIYSHLSSSSLNDSINKITL
jgi:integrase/recombinase XerD